MCSEYNGIQVFLYPMTLIYWISTTSILVPLTTLLSVRMHYLPLTFFGVFLVYVCFMVLKIYTCIFPGPHKLYPKLMDEFYDLVVQLHLVLFVTIIIIMVYYVLSRFLGYFYSIDLALKKGVLFFFRAFTVLLILYYYLKSMWLKPLRERNYSQKKSTLLVTGWISRNVWAAVKYTGMMSMVVFAAVKLYLIIIAYFLTPALSGLKEFLGLKLEIELIPIDGISSILYNLFMLAAAFMLSNLLFYPIIVLSQKLNNSMHPMKIKQVPYAQD
ncbi:MAG: hypothetical protein RBR69_02630 [Candidatus Cloacimonadaceae bacterium]|jgi:hypothetical protein|nr:hypothetical protein [Candidatus Cloacimonadota bacterium]MCK9178296.1 hypothetical protein [Candidatus Cloacimonadota bacterium]MDD3533468.1 hypothetical protein [Candidatus Cloacimonadota bacterium]MDY0127012.1 hypothetical protein [Candidatus Cloacimonadaceae bacterium]